MAPPRPRVQAGLVTEPNGLSAAMIDLNHIDELARRLSDLVPPGLR